MPEFSIITVNFNSGDKLAATAESVRVQSADAEYIIVDGGSTDQSLAIARAMSDRYPGTVRLISEPDKGIYDAMNKGVRYAQGRYIYFLGAGDRLLPHVLASVSARLPEDHRSIVYGDVLWRGACYDGEFDRLKLAQRNICHQAMFFGRGVFETMGCYDLRYPRWADWEFNLRCFGTRRIRKVYIGTTVAEFEPDGVSSSGDSAFASEKLQLLRRHYGLLWYWRHMRLPRILSRTKRRLSGFSNLLEARA